MSYPTEFSMEKSVISSKCLLVLWVFRFFDDFHQNDSCFKVRGRVLVSFEYSGMFPLSYISAFPSVISTHHFASAFWGLFQKAFHIKHFTALVKPYQTEVIYYKLNVNPFGWHIWRNPHNDGKKKKKRLKDFSHIVSWHKG